MPNIPLPVVSLPLASFNSAAVFSNSFFRFSISVDSDISGKIVREQDVFEAKSFWVRCKLRSFPAGTQWLLLWESYQTGEWGPSPVFSTIPICEGRGDVCVDLECWKELGGLMVLMEWDHLDSLVDITE